MLAEALAAAYPSAVLLGEEATAHDPALLDRFRAADHAFTIDPVDGTRNFVHGSPDHAVMVAEIRGGETVRSWIWQPQHRVAYVAERGGGAWRDGVRLTRPPIGERLRGVTSRRSLDRPRARDALRARADLGLLRGRLPQAGGGRGRLRRLPPRQAVGPRARVAPAQRGGRPRRHVRRRALPPAGRSRPRDWSRPRTGRRTTWCTACSQTWAEPRVSRGRPGPPGRDAATTPWSPWRRARPRS